MEKQTSSRNTGLDTLKLLCAALVIGIHGGFLKETSPLLSYLCTSAFFRVAVSLFFVISGYFFFRTAHSGRASHWFKRVGWLFVLWTALYSYFWWPYIKAALLGFWHLWFLSALLGGALLLYLARRLAPKVLLFTAILLFLVGYTIEYLGSYGVVAAFSKFFLYRNFLFYAYPMLTLGYLLAREDAWRTWLEARTGRFLALGGVLLLVEGLVNFHTGKFFDMLLGQLFATPALFLIARRWQPRWSVPPDLSTGMFLIHLVGLFLLKARGFQEGTLLTLLTFIFASVAGYLLVVINRKWRVLL